MQILKKLKNRSKSLETIEEVPQIVDRFSNLNKKVFFIEIGANDGVSADLIHDFIVRDRWEGILVEPVKFVFERLVKNYSKQKGLAFENIAIGEIDGTKEFYWLKKTDDKLPVFYDRLGSFVKDVLLYHKHAIPNIEDYIMVDQVKTLTFESLAKKHKVKKLDVVAIDTEGYDFEIIKLINYNELAPKLIIFENKHLKPEVYSESEKFLKSKGYIVYKRGGNSLAIKKNLKKKLNILTT